LKIKLKAEPKAPKAKIDLASLTTSRESKDKVRDILKARQEKLDERKKLREELAKARPSDTPVKCPLCGAKKVMCITFWHSGRSYSCCGTCGMSPTPQWRELLKKAGMFPGQDVKDEDQNRTKITLKIKKHIRIRVV